MKKFLLSIMSLAMFFSPVQILANEEEVVEDVVVEEETVVEDEVIEEVVVDEEEIVETEDDYNTVTTDDGVGYWRKQADGRWKFQYANGTYAKDEFLTIGGYNYYFDANGYMKTGWLKYSYSDGSYDWLYYESNGHEVSGWKQINGKWYYFNPENDNFMVSWGWITINGQKYYFLENGAMATGIVNIGDENMLFDQNGHQVTITGWTKIDGYWYYTMNGYPYVSDWADIDDETYRFDEKGHLIKGWYKSQAGYWYYYDEKGHEASGWKQISGKWYYFDPSSNNVMVNDDVMMINGSYYLFQPNGAMANSGWVSLTDGSYKAWFYANSNGKLTLGWKKIDGKWYFFAEYYSCAMLREDWVFDDVKEVYYYFDASGAMVTNKWVKDDEGSWRYYLASGAEAVGWLKLDGKWYYLDPDNDDIMACDTTLTINDKEYTFNSKGVWVA